MVQLIDCIEKQMLFVVLFDCVWVVVSNFGEFGQWFGVLFDGLFEVGQLLFGCIIFICVDDDVVKVQEFYVGIVFEIVVDCIEFK